MSTTSTEKFLADLKILTADAEDILQATANQADSKVSDLREKLKQSLRTVQAKASAFEQTAVDSAKVAARVSDQYVHDHTWQSIGIASAVGLLVGILIGRR